MRLALLCLTLITVHVSVTVDCRKRHQRPTHSWRTAALMSAGAGPFHSEQNGSTGKHNHRGLLVIFPIKTTTNTFVSIFDLRKKRLLCADVNGELYKSRRKDRRDCLFQRFWLKQATPRDAFYSTSGNWLIRLGGGDLRVARRGPLKASAPLLQRFLHPFVKRQRRSEEVNPADPLRSESHPSQSSQSAKDVNPGQPEQDQAGAVSKETISSCDDPLQVLQANGDSSPVKTNIGDRPEHQ